MKLAYALVAILLLVVSCSPQQPAPEQQACPAGETLINDACCVDANANSLCDDNEPQAPVEIPEEPAANVTEPPPSAELYSGPLLGCWYWQSTWNDGVNHYGQSCFHFYDDKSCTVKQVLDGRWTTFDGTFTTAPNSGNNTAFNCTNSTVSRSGTYYPLGSFYYKKEHFTSLVEGYTRIHEKYLCNNICS